MRVFYTDSTRLHKDPRSEESEDIAEGEEKCETDDDIHCPSFCLLGILFALTAPCPKYSCSDECEYSEEHSKVDEPFRDSSDHSLECCHSFSDTTFIFTILYIDITRTSFTRSVCARIALGQRCCYLRWWQLVPPHAPNEQLCLWAQCGHQRRRCG